MSRIRINHSIFPLGQVSGGVLGNLDMEMYNNALQICKNFVPRAVGGLRKRVGSRFLAKLPNGVDGLRPIILPYYVTDVDYSLISLLIVIIPQPKAQANNNFHEPRIRFYNLEENDWIKKDNVIFEIKFKVATGLLDHPYVFPICPSFEQLQSVQTIQNGNSIILFSKFFPLVIEKAYPFSIKMQDFTVGPYSFRTSGLMLHPRIIKEENEHSTPLALKKIVIYDVLKGNIPSSNLLLSPPIFLSGLLINKAFPELLNQGLDANSYSVFSNDSLTFSGTSFGNTNQRIVVMYKNSDSAKPDLAWNGVIQDVRITKRTDNDAYVATLVVKWINEECPQDASNDNTVPLPGTEPTNSNIPDSGPQETSNWYMSTISLDSSLLGELQFNENEEDKKVYVQELQNEDFTQTRNPLENFTNLRRGGSGFPKCVLLYDGRLFLANIGDDVNGIWGSSKKLSDWFNFKPGIDSGDGVRQKISTTRMGFINWLAATSRLFVGTQEGVYIGGSVNSSSESVITSSGVSFNLISKISTSELRPVAAADSLLFTDIKGTSLFEIVLDSGGVYRVNEISLLSGGFLDPGVASHTWLEHPDKCYFAALKNGILRSVTYMKNNNIIGWAQHYLGANAHDAFVKSVDSMLVDNYNELIMVVERNINGENALYLEGIRGIEEEENDLSNVYADCAKLFQVDFDIYAIKRSRFFAITPNFNLGEAVDRNNSPIFFWTGGENTTIFEKNVGFSFFMGDANQDFIQCENGSVTDENWNPPADYENLVHIFGWKNSVPSLADGIITITMTDRAHFEEKLLILPGFSATFGGQSADFLQNKDAVFWMNHEGQVCSRDEPHNPVQFQLEEGAMANIDPSFELGTLDHINVNVIGAVNARVVIDDSVDEVRKSLNDQSSDKIPNGYFRILKLNKFLTIDNRAYLVPKNNDGFQVEAYEDDESKCQLRLYFVDDIHSPESQKFFVNLSSEAELTIVSSGVIFLYQQFLQGLEHLLGESVHVSVNGNDLGNVYTVVAVGDFVGLSLDNLHLAYTAYVGYAYESLILSAPVVAPSPIVGSSVGLSTYQTQLVLKLYNSIGGKYGSTEEDLIPIEYRRIGPVTNEPMAPFTGMLTLSQTNFSLDLATYCIRHDTAEPFTILSVTQDIKIADDAV